MGEFIEYAHQMQPLPTLQDDGLITPVVGDWAEEKYQLIRCYAEIFSTSMKTTWQNRVYLDLFSGAGRARIRGTKRIIPAVPLLVTGLKYPFTTYIFSELSHEKTDALRKRIGSDPPNADVHYVEGETNSIVDALISLIPEATRGQKVLTFCLADPYRLADLRFETIARIAEERFERSGQRFAEFVVDQFGRSMRRLGYKYDGLENAHLMTTTARRLPIYHLVMYSRHSLGGNFWEKCKAAAMPQRTLFPT